MFYIVIFGLIHVQEIDEYYCYNPNPDYGTGQAFNPGTGILYGSFEVLRNGAHSKDILEQKYLKGINNVWWNITHPIKNIEQYGGITSSAGKLFP